MQPAPSRLAQWIRIAWTRSVAPACSPIRDLGRPQASFHYQTSQQAGRNRVAPARLYARKASTEIRADTTGSRKVNQQQQLQFSSGSLKKRLNDRTQTDTVSNDGLQEHHKAKPNEALPSHTESRRNPLSQRFSHLMDNLQSNIFTASQRLNDLTGYSGIEALKRSIDKQEEIVSQARHAVKAARSAYSHAVNTRSMTQREVNDLLQRKHNWSPADLERFTVLYRSDHTNEQAEQRAQDELSQCERAAEEASNALAKSILARYHEEQIWSDKIRQMSTWGTWGLMGVNVLLFLIFQVAIEPWRRSRLVKGFEDKVVEALEREKRPGETVSQQSASIVMREEPPPPSPPAAVEEHERRKAPIAPGAIETTNMQDSSAQPGLSAASALMSGEPTPSQPAMLSDDNDPRPRSSWWSTLLQHYLPANFSTSPSSTSNAESSSLSGHIASASVSSAAVKSLSELFSDTQTHTMTQRQVTALVAQSAALGGFVVGVFIMTVARFR